MGMTRKVLRFGRSLPVLKQLMDRIKLHEKKPVRMIFFRTISDLLLAIYYLSDHPIFLYKVGIYRGEKSFVDRIEWWSDFIWLIESIIDVVCDIVELFHI
jgi:hypothetical protein